MGKPGAINDLPAREEGDVELVELRRTRQRALDALLRARLEGRSARTLAILRCRADRAAHALFVGRLIADANRSAPQSQSGWRAPRPRDGS